MATQKKFVVKNGLISQNNVDITGNLTISGTVDGRNIATDGAKLDNVAVGATAYSDSNVASYLGSNGYGTSSSIVASITDSAPGTLDTLNELAAALDDDANFSTTVTNSIATKLPLAGGTMTGDILYGDGVKAMFGAGSDLQIFHTGGTSVINDVGTGKLFIGGSPGVDIGAPEIDEYYIRAYNDGAVELYYDNAKKIETTSTGIDVTGTVTSDGLLVEGETAGQGASIEVHATVTEFGDALLIAKSDNANTFIHAGVKIQGSDNPFYIYQSGGTATNKLRFNYNAFSDTGGQMTIASNGDISFYEDTGTTAKFHWDAADERLGIGTTTPATTLHVRGTASTVGANRSVVTLTDDTSMGINVGSGIAFRGLYTSAGAEANYGGIFAGKANANSGNANGYLSLSYSASGTLTEGVRISESGNVGIGTTAPGENLEVYQGSTNGGIFLHSTTADSYIKFGNDTNSWFVSHDGNNNSGSNNSLQISEDGVNTRVMVAVGGNVGIGTSSPATALEVNGAILAKVHHEVFTVGTIASNIVSLDLNTGSSVVTVASPAANFSLAIANALNTGNTTTGIAIIVTQGSSPFIPNTLTVNGSTVTINWLGGSAPAGTASKTEIFSFTIINTGGVFTALGSVSTFG